MRTDPRNSVINSRTIAIASLIAATASLAVAALPAVPPSLAAPAPSSPAVNSPAQTIKAAKPTPMPKLKLQRVAPEVVLRRPIQVVFEPASDKRMYVVEQAGRILVIDPADREAKEASVFLDMRKQVNSRGNEEGLLSVVFHPDFAKNHFFFTYYTAMNEDNNRVDVLSRWSVDKETQKWK